MTGYESKRAAARDKLDDDDTLTIAYQSGYYDGKKAAQPAQEPDTYRSVPHGHCTHPRCKEVFSAYIEVNKRLAHYEPEGKSPMILNAAPPQRTEQCNYPDCKCPTENPCLKGLAQPAQEPWRESASDYERGFIDGMQKQSQSSVDKAVNAMTQRTWVGLANHDWNSTPYDTEFRAGAEWAEAKLKEKNT